MSRRQRWAVVVLLIALAVAVALVAVTMWARRAVHRAR